MKMSEQSYNYIVKAFGDNVEEIKQHAKDVKASGKYNDFNIRLANDCKTQYIGTRYVVDVLYNKDGLTDTHVNTGLIRALKEIGVI